MTNSSIPKFNQINQKLVGQATADGDGVKLTRIIGGHQLNELDPFLLLDHFGSDEASDYIGGFPPHPHRGFETVTYMLKGKMRHQDSVGNNGVIEDGGVQWMTAGSGIIHSEMPEQTEGMLSGFQLWVNLPAKAKMIKPEYQEFKHNEIPVEKSTDGISIKVIAGKTSQGTSGVIHNNHVNPNYWDIHMPGNTKLLENIPTDHHAFIYVYQGTVHVGDNGALQNNQLAVLSPGELLKIQAQQDSRFIVVSGKPLNEPIKRAGPFVMNTQQELQQAFADYQAGTFIK
jgi:redox-sensitive bicupin YhaK (pirin superfamily)